MVVDHADDVEVRGNRHLAPIAKIAQRYRAEGRLAQRLCSNDAYGDKSSIFWVDHCEIRIRLHLIADLFDIGADGDVMELASEDFHFCLHGDVELFEVPSHFKHGLVEMADDFFQKGEDGAPLLDQLASLVENGPKPLGHSIDAAKLKL